MLPDVQARDIVWRYSGLYISHSLPQNSAMNLSAEMYVPSAGTASSGAKHTTFVSCIFSGTRSLTALIMSFVRYLWEMNIIFEVVAGMSLESSREPLWGSIGTGCAPILTADQNTRYHSMLLGIQMPTLSFSPMPSFFIPEPITAVFSIKSLYVSSFSSILRSTLSGVV